MYLEAPSPHFLFYFLLQHRKGTLCYRNKHQGQWRHLSNRSITCRDSVHRSSEEPEGMTWARGEHGECLQSGREGLSQHSGKLASVMKWMTWGKQMGVNLCLSCPIMRAGQVSLKCQTIYPAPFPNYNSDTVSRSEHTFHCAWNTWIYAFVP